MPSFKLKNNILPLIIVSVIIFGILYIYWPYVSTIVLAGTFAVVLYSPYQKVCRYVSERKAASIVVFLSFILLIVILSFVFSVFIHSSGYIAEMSQTISFWLKNMPDVGPLEGNFFGSSVTRVTGVFQNTIIQVASSIPQFLISVLFFLLSLYLFLLSGKECADELFSAIPEHLQVVTKELQKDAVNTLYATYVVNLKICCITFLIALPFFAFLGVKGGILENATLTAVSQLVPTVGPLVVLCFICLYALALGDVTLAIIVILAGFILFMFIPGNILKPRMMGKRISLPAPMMLIAILGAMATIGLPGIILGPLFASLLVSGYRMLIIQMKVMKGELPNLISASE